MHENTDETRAVSRAVARIHAGVLAVVCGLIGGVGLLTMTVWLLIRGGPRVGPHLGLLSQYFYGYSVTWTGSLIGFVYGVLVGGAIGWLIGAVYNGVVGLRQ
jgi:hypothetical protein